MCKIMVRYCFKVNANNAERDFQIEINYFKLRQVYFNLQQSERTRFEIKFQIEINFYIASFSVCGNRKCVLRVIADLFDQIRTYSI